MAIRGKKEVIQNLKREIKRIEERVIHVLRTHSRLLVTHIRANYLTGGTTRTRLRKRTGKLSSSLQPLRVKKISTGYRAGVKFGAKYASTHVGKKGKVTTIRPKSAKMLAIPLSAAKTGRGVPRGKPKDKNVFGDTFIAKSKRGNLIIFGKQKRQKGKNVGKTFGNIVPLFVLKKKVKVRARIHPKPILKWVKPKIKKSLKGIV